MKKILPIFIPFLGCESRCIFCNQNLITGTDISYNTLFDNINNQYNQYIKFSTKFDAIAFYGGNFGALDKDIRIALYNYAKSKDFKKINFSTAPNTITDEILDEIDKYNINLVELGVQSLDNDVLIANGRRYSFDDIKSAIERVSQITNCGIQMMVGMYNQSLISPIEDAKILTKFDIKTVRIYPTVVIKDTVLEEYYNNGRYKILDFNDAIIVTAITTILYLFNNIKILRLSLPDDINSADNIVAGLYHPAFGDIVRTIIILLYLEFDGKFVGTANEIFKFSGYQSVARRYYEKSFNIDEHICCIKFDDIIEYLYQWREIFEDSSRLFKSKTADIAKTIIYSTNNR